ncbi:MAG: hypothetical protein ACTSRA_23295, partial [Promethearchaeota archaeon]
MHNLTEKWCDPIDVRLITNRLRIGGQQEYSSVKLPIHKEQNSWVSINLASSFKGLLRNLANIIVNS